VFWVFSIESCKGVVRYLGTKPILTKSLEVVVVRDVGGYFGCKNVKRLFFQSAKRFYQKGVYVPASYGSILSDSWWFMVPIVGLLVQGSAQGLRFYKVSKKQSIPLKLSFCLYK
jgi:hypothetical protein